LPIFRHAATSRHCYWYRGYKTLRFEFAIGDYCFAYFNIS
jgi:hypothetical protein